MSKLMLIDSTHAEETRVVVLSGTTNPPRNVDEFDFESHARKQLRGNIYLAKVTRVEPSLQAAFVEYGGNRHGFLAFNEIHPDYYQIPVADREALMAELAQAAQKDNGRERDSSEGDEDELEDDGDELPEDERRLRQHLIRRYKIQEVIKRRQILLVQVVKEERGNKGAALTTYLSLAGRYGVLMPNTARGGGISRKITNAADRKRLKTMVSSLDVPHGMGLIVRTAGAKRTKQEIKRDYDYLLRVWENIRENTLKSNAPALIYEEEDLVKRAIRDLFDKDFDGVLVEGEDGYRSAKDFMRMIMPSQAKKIQLYKSNSPLFARYGVEEHLAKIYSPVVPMRSGGYLVINQTEALVAIDVNSGKSTKERNIEATALKTNLEAAEEAARQIKLRDLAGLVVIDFIDMDEAKNNRAVEKKLKDALSEDRARIQMGKISGFGLMEISRQRRRTGVLEGTTVVCPHCEGLGRVRSVDSSALTAMRAIDLEAMQNGAGALTVKLPMAVALYILNEKQAHLTKLRTEWGLKVNVEIDPDLTHAEFQIVRTLNADEVDFVAPLRAEPLPFDTVTDDDFVEDEDDEDEAALEAEDMDDDQPADRKARHDHATGEDKADDRRGGRRRRRRRGGREREEEAAPLAAEANEADSEAGDEDEDEDARRNRRRRRGRRGGRRTGFESRPREPYGWVRARTPSLEEPYVWIDPFDETQRRPEAPRENLRDNQRDAGPREGREPRPPREAREPRVLTDASGLGEATLAPTSLVPDALKDQPAPKRQRPPRKPRPGSEAVAEAVVAEAPVVLEEAVAIDEVAPTEDAKPARKTRSRRKVDTEDKAQEAVMEAEAPVPVEAKKPSGRGAKKAAPAPVAEVVAPVDTPAPRLMEMAETTPDPAEISAPPEKPKRGWWRR